MTFDFVLKLFKLNMLIPHLCEFYAFKGFNFCFTDSHVKTVVGMHSSIYEPVSFKLVVVIDFFYLDICIPVWVSRTFIHTFGRALFRLQEERFWTLFLFWWTVVVLLAFAEHSCKEIVFSIMIIVIKMMALKGGIGDFYSLLTVPRTVSNTYTHMARAWSWANHMQLAVCHVVWRDNSAVKFDWV